MNVHFLNAGHRSAMLCLLVLFFLLSPASIVPASAQALTQAEFDSLREKYPNLGLAANMSAYNIIVRNANQLTDANLRSAITTAGTSTTPQNTLIVLRTTATQNYIELTGGQLSININASTRGSVTIVSLGTHALTIDGKEKSRIFAISGTATVVDLGGLELTNGRVDNTGGGINNNNATVTMEKCTITQNRSDRGGGINNENRGTMHVFNSYITGNTVRNRNASIVSRFGGGISNITNSKFYIMNSVIAGNLIERVYGAGTGAARGVGGGGIFNEASEMTVVNCTIAGNYMRNTTESGNWSRGAGIHNRSTLTIHNSIVARNAHNNSSTLYDIYQDSGKITGSNNLIGTSLNTSSNVSFTNNIATPVPRNPNFQDIPTANTNSTGWEQYDVDKWNLRLRSDSLAINAGNNILNNTTMDIAGNARISDDRIDIGAYEAGFVMMSGVPYTHVTISNGGDAMRIGNREPLNNSYHFVGVRSDEKNTYQRGESIGFSVATTITVGTSIGTSGATADFSIGLTLGANWGWDWSICTDYQDGEIFNDGKIQYADVVGLGRFFNSTHLAKLHNRSSGRIEQVVHVLGHGRLENYGYINIARINGGGDGIGSLTNHVGGTIKGSEIKELGLLSNFGGTIESVTVRGGQLGNNGGTSTSSFIGTVIVENGTLDNWGNNAKIGEVGLKGGRVINDATIENLIYSGGTYSGTGTVTNLVLDLTSRNLGNLTQTQLAAYFANNIVTVNGIPTTQIVAGLNINNLNKFTVKHGTTEIVIIDGKIYKDGWGLNSTGRLTAAPTNLRSTAVTANSVTLAWNAPNISGTVTPYRLERSTNGTTWTVVSSTITSTTHTATGLDANVNYQFRVSAVNSAPSAVVFATTPRIPLTDITPSTNSPQVGTPITTTLSPSGATVTYRWFRGSTQVGTSASYTPVVADVGQSLRVEATGTGNFTGTVSHTLSNAVSRIALTSITPSTNTPQLGTAITTTLAPSGATASYRWFRGSTQVGTSASYTPVAADAGQFLRVEATGSGSYIGTVSHTLTYAVPSMTPDDFNDIQAKYPGLNLGDYGDYDGVVIAANQLASDTALRDAITAPSINGLDKLIVLRTAPGQDTVALTGGELPITSGNVTIVSLGTENLTINAGGKSRVFNIGTDATVGLVGLTITGGSVNGNGGAIVNNGTLTVASCMVTGNSAGSIGGGIHNSGSGTLTIMDSVISGNSAISLGGGIHNDGGILTVMTSIIQYNSAFSGGGIFSQEEGTLTLENCLIVENVAEFGGGGIFNGGSLFATNSTVTGNTGMFMGGGIYNGNTNVITINNSIIADNSSLVSRDVFHDNSMGTIVGSNNLIGCNQSYGAGQSFFVHGQDGNIVGTEANPINPRFDGDYRLTACSPAINNGSDDLAGPLTIDLDGNPRFNGTIDIGAYEFQGIPGHDYEWTYTAPTHTEDGYWTGICIDCGDVVYETGPSAAGCIFEWFYTDPTCTEDGYWTFTCTDCGNVAYEIDPNSAFCDCVLVNLRVVQRGQNAVSLQWNAVACAMGYIVERECPLGWVEEFFTDVARFVDTGLDADTTYAYSVRTLTSDFSEPIFVTTLQSTTTDVPIVLSTTTDEFGQTTIVWTDLGEDYIYTIYRQGQVVALNISENWFTDENPPPTWTTAEFSIRARSLSGSGPPTTVTTIAWNTSVRQTEFTGFEITVDGITLYWNVEEGETYQIMRRGEILASNLLFDGWTDENPGASNDYVLVTSYFDENDRRVRTYSNTFTVQWMLP
ncbi:MAG: fibronectin type III domain-containing protein [Planctomycetaceae bacterium]|nr:fibronectin type III domain-containing protein [Planctomycetaceae bacterium]